MDKNNFSEIYKKYVMTAYSAAMQVVHNEADADDIAQETMVKMTRTKKWLCQHFADKARERGFL